MFRRLLVPLFVLLLGGCGPSVGTKPPEETADAGVETVDAGSVLKCRPACGAAQECVEGHCVAKACEAEKTRCGALCVDLSSNPFHCGACGDPCGAAWPVCSGGICGSSCGGSFCPVTHICDNSHCCPSGTNWCIDRCLDTRSDLSNCGGCGEICTSNGHGNETCMAGVCDIGCTMPYAECNHTCVDYSNDTQNCGECGYICGSGQTCGAGHCARQVVTCTINASGVWQGCSGLEVRTGDTFIMTATGTWTPSNDRGPNGPAGSIAPAGLLDVPYDTTFRVGALLWSVEDTSSVFAFLSGSATGVASDRGKLQFRMNNLSFVSASGTLTVTVSLLP